MKKFIRVCLTIFILIGLVALLTQNLRMREQGVCMQQRLAVEQSSLGKKPGAALMLPQCNWDGGYLAQQCNFETQTCWCVNLKGQPVHGTIVPQSAGQPAACPLNWIERLLLIWQTRSQHGSVAAEKVQKKVVTQ